MPRRKRMDTDSESSSSDTESDGSSDGFDSADESKMIKKYNRKHGERTHVGKSNRAKHGSSYLRLTTQGVDQFASTPVSIFDELCARYAPAFGQKTLFDPCPEFYDKKTGGRINKPGYDGLKEDWGRVNYVNPPYGQIKNWFPKAIEQQAKGNTSIFLVPLRPFTAYFVETSPHVSWAEVIYYGVGFKGYAGKIPHPMCTIVFLGKGVKDRPEFHMTVEHNKKIHNFAGAKKLTCKIKCRKHCYVQKVPKPCAFDNATEICRNHGIPTSRIHIMINSSNMVSAGYLAPERMAKARKHWKHAYALLVPFYNYSVAFQVGMREATILAYSSPILSNYAGEGKCRFCSVLFVFCPTNHKNFKAIVKQKNLHPFKMYFNYNGYMPTLEELKAAKLKKIQKTKAMHMAKQRGVMKKQGRKGPGGHVTSTTKSRNKSKSAKKASKKKPAKKPARKPSKKPARKTSKKKSAKKASKKPVKKASKKKPAKRSAKKASKKAPAKKGQRKAAPIKLDRSRYRRAMKKYKNIIGKNCRKAKEAGAPYHNLISRWVTHYTVQHGKLPKKQQLLKYFGCDEKQGKAALFYVLDQAMHAKKRREARAARKRRNGSSASGRPAKRQKLMPTAGGSPRSG